jgi:hypothetical protein
MRDDDAIDAVLAAAPSEFVATRARVAAELKAAGDTAGAARVRALRRPSPSVWAVNQLARRDPDAVGELLLAGAQLLAAERRALAGEAGTFLADARAERHRVAALARRAEAILATSGQRASAATARRIAQTLQAAAIGDDATRDALRAGRLRADLEPPTGFGAVLEGAPPAAPARVAGAQQRVRSAEDKPASVADRQRATTSAAAHKSAAAADRQSARAAAAADRERARAAAAAAKRARAEAAAARKREAARQRAVAAADRAVATQRRAVDRARAAVEEAEQHLRTAKDALAQAELAAATARRDAE